MKDQYFRTLLDLIMCSDPWPVRNEHNQRLIEELAGDEAKKRGFADWIDAYHNYKIS